MQTHIQVSAFILSALILAQTAVAQVTVNPQALEPQGQTTAPVAPASGPRTHPAHPTPPRPVLQTHPNAAHPNAAHPVPPVVPKPAPLIVPPVPPPPAILAPLSPPPPAHPTELPPLAPVVPNAAGVASEITGGMRITFGTGSAALNPATDQALRHMAHASPTSVFTLNAYTPGQLDDPSTPRRLSLDRALAARSVLMAEGIPSTHIIARGYQFMPGANADPADRVDVLVGTSAAPKP